MLRNKTHSEFIRYLEQMADDFEESGCSATAADYRECVRRLDEIAYNAARVVDYVTEKMETYNV